MTDVNDDSVLIYIYFILKKVSNYRSLLGIVVTSFSLFHSNVSYSVALANWVHTVNLSYDLANRYDRLSLLGD